VRCLSLLLLLLLIATSAFAAAPSTVNNDDSCDVTVAPAATLLLPYFEVDFTTNRVQDTLFTITNVTRLPQIAHVTIWTDWSYPVFAFNIYLTGYDVQGISMGDILNVNGPGFVAQASGTGPTTAQSPLGALSAGFTANPNFAGGGASINCNAQPGPLSPSLLSALRTALTTGIDNPVSSSACGAAVGGNHANGNAIGYVTVDVVASCTSRLPTDPLYYTNDLLFDNVLIGDYQQLGPTASGTTAAAFDAGVNPLVHIRAVPEGGSAGSKVATALPYTFYDRYTPASGRTIDRRQPLPSTFAARFIQGGPATYRTNLSIWREGFGNGSCSDAKSLATMAVAEVVRFDEHENPSTLGSDPLRPAPQLPATSSTSSSNSSYPATLSSDTGGWLYLNLNNGGSTTYSAHAGASTNEAPSLAPAGSTTTAGPRPSQNWVTVTMFGTSLGNRQAAAFDAASLGTGCSPAAFPSSAAAIGPAGGVFECPPGTTLTNGSIALCAQTTATPATPAASAERRRATGRSAPSSSIDNDDSCDIKVGPAATLLLPYFEVDLAGTSGQTTLFTVTNVTQYPQIAHVTLWTDYAYPVMTFNLFLGGYDVQAINLADVLIRNTIASSAGITPGSIWRAANPNLRASIDCAGIPGVVPATIMAVVRTALTTGGFAGSCNKPVGAVHAHAIGYATIDVVASCTSRSPSDPLYYTNDLLFDNVLIGDYQQLVPHPAGVTPSSSDATGNPMVHIRSVPEGGGAGSSVSTRLPYTFYDRYTPTGARTMDRRQPLPSTFAARYIQGGPRAFATNFTMWREGFGVGSCADALASGSMIVSEIIRFDEHENPNLSVPCFFDPCPAPQPPTLNAASSTNTASGTYAVVSTADVGGWMYLNLNNGGSTSYSVTKDIGGQRAPTNARTSLSPIGSTTTTGPRPSQNWVTVTLFGFANSGNRLTGEFDAAPLGNGCSPTARLGAIGPAGGVLVCPPGTTPADGSTTKCTGTNINPTP